MQVRDLLLEQSETSPVETRVVPRNRSNRMTEPVMTRDTGSRPIVTVRILTLETDGTQAPSPHILMTNSSTHQNSL